MISYGHKNSQAAYLICCLSYLNKWQHYVVKFFSIFWGEVGKGGLVPLCLLDIQGGQFHQCVTNQQQGHYNLPTKHWGEVCKEILLINWVRWVICKTTDSQTQFHTGRRFTPHKHDHNGQEEMKLHKKKNKMIVCKYKGDIHIHQT